MNIIGEKTSFVFSRQLRDYPLFQDEENEFLIFEAEADQKLCICASNSCCRGWPQQDHGITEAMKSFRKYGKKKEKRKKTSIDLLQDASVQTEDNYKMEVDSVQEVDPVVSVAIDPDSITKPAKAESCCSSNKSQGGESDIRCDSDSINSLNNSDMTPSDQRSNNENGSSLKESDGDAMSKKSDSSSSDKHLASSESDSESKGKIIYGDFFDKLFTSLHMCFPHSHKNMVPWLADVNFDEEIKMKYHLVTDDQDSVLERDRQQLAMLDEPELVGDQLSALMEDFQDSNMDISSVMLSSEPSSLETHEKDVAISE